MLREIFKNKLAIIFLSLIISLNLLGLFAFLLAPTLASAQETQNSEEYCGDTSQSYIQLNIPIPGFTQTKTVGDEKIYVVRDLSCYLYYFYKYFAGVVGILAAVMIIYGGFRYLTSFGNPTRMATAKDQITSAIIGLIITLGTYVILFVINPAIVNLRLPNITSINPISQNFTFMGYKFCNRELLRGDCIKEIGPTCDGFSFIWHKGQKDQCIWTNCQGDWVAAAAKGYSENLNFLDRTKFKEGFLAEGIYIDCEQKFKFDYKDKADSESTMHKLGVVDGICGEIRKAAILGMSAGVGNHCFNSKQKCVIFLDDGYCLNYAHYAGDACAVQDDDSIGKFWSSKCI